MAYQVHHVGVCGARFGPHVDRLTDSMERGAGVAQPRATHALAAIGLATLLALGAVDAAGMTFADGANRFAKGADGRLTGKTVGNVPAANHMSTRFDALGVVGAEWLATYLTSVAARDTAGCATGCACVGGWRQCMTMGT